MFMRTTYYLSLLKLEYSRSKWFGGVPELSAFNTKPRQSMHRHSLGKVSCIIISLYTTIITPYRQNMACYFASVITLSNLDFRRLISWSYWASQKMIEILIPRNRREYICSKPLLITMLEFLPCLLCTKLYYMGFLIGGTQTGRTNPHGN